MILMLATSVAFGLLGLAMVAAVVRVIAGPSLADRIVGLDMTTVLGIGLISVFAVRTGLALYADLAIGLALVGFVSTLAFARYLLGRGQP